MKKIICLALSAFILMLSSSPSYAVTGCNVAISSLWTGDAGTVWVASPNGQFYVLSSHLSQKHILSSVYMAIAPRSDNVGIWLPAN